MKKVFISLSFPPEMIAGFHTCIEYLESNGFEVVLDPNYRTLNRDELAAGLKDAYAFVASGEVVDAALLDRTPQLRIVSRMGVGYDKVDVAELNRRGIALTTTPGANAEAVAEFAVSMMMTVTRKVKQIDTFTREGVWKTHFGSSVGGKTLGIIGLGNIGKKVAQFLSGFNMETIAYDVYPDAAYAESHGIRMAPLDEVISSSDYLFIHTPYTKETYHMMNAETFGMMKKGAFFFNCARGELVDETALYDALKSGHLTGAGIDVFEKEPVSMDNPLFTLDNLVVSSHTAGMTYEGRKKVVDMSFQNIIDLSNGVQPKGLVNKQVMDHFSK